MLHINTWITSCVWLFRFPHLHFSSPQIRDSGSPCRSLWLWSQRGSTDSVVCSYFLCPGLSGHSISLSSHCWAPSSYFPSPSPAVATENKRLECERKRLKGGVIFVDAAPPHPPLSISTRQSARWDCPPETSPLYHLTPISPPPGAPCKKENLYQNVQRCVFRIYIYETQNKKRKILR